MSTSTLTATRRPAPARVAPARPTPAPRAHLTRRGRLLVLSVLVVLLFGAFSAGRAATQASTTAGDAPSAPVVTTVQPGDTLWALARRVAPGHDPRVVVEQIRRLNDLPGAGVQAGQQLVLPTVR